MILVCAGTAACGRVSVPGDVDGGGSSRADAPAMDGGDAAPAPGLIEPCSPGGPAGPVSGSGVDVAPTGIYSNWFWPDTALTSFEWQLGIESEPADGYFWAHQFAFAVEGGFVGLQQNGAYQADPPSGPIQVTKMALFSIAGPAIAAETGDVPYPEGRAYGEFDGAPGWTVHIKYDWAPCRVYLLRLVKLSTEADGNVWWGGYVRDTATDVDTLIGRILVPPEQGYLGTWSVMWTERFGPSALTECEQQGYASAIFGTPTANDGAIAPSVADHRFSDQLHCPNSRFSPVAGGMRQEMGVPP
jgi:hypothetical protein